MRIKLDSEVSIPYGTTKTVTVYAPQGFHVVTGWFDLASGGAPVGTINLLSSRPTMVAKWIDEGMSNFPLSDGSTAVTIPSEGWIFKVNNGDTNNRVVMFGLVCEEGVEVATSYYNSGSYPSTVV